MMRREKRARPPRALRTNFFNIDWLKATNGRTTPAAPCDNPLYGGPQTATVTGTYRGRPVDASFDRTDGCAIDRWNKVDIVLVVRGTVLEHPLATPSGG